MRLAVVGAGAMGGSLAAHAARAGHDVTVVDVAEAVVARIRGHGVTVRAPEGPFTGSVAATTDPGTVGAVDVAVVFVKSQHTDSAGRTLQTLAGPDTVVVTLQNGWGNADRLAAFVDPARLVIGVTYNSCTSLGPGEVAHSGRGRTVVGPYSDDGGDDDGARTAADLLTSSGWEAEVSPDVRTEIWRKLVLNSATLPTAALTRLSAGGVAAQPELLGLVDALADETVAVARAQGMDIDAGERRAAIHQVLRAAGDGRPSMLQDVLAGRKTEIETVNGAVVTAAADHDVDVPLNRAVLALVHGVEAGWAS